MCKAGASMKAVLLVIIAAVSLICFTGCQGEDPAPPIKITMPQVSATVVYNENDAVLDASNTAEGYVMIKYEGASTARLKVLINGPKGAELNFNLNTAGNYEVFSLTDGDGDYTIGVYQNIEDNKYTALLTKKVNVALNSEYAPFLIPNQFVNYDESSKAVELGFKLAGGSENTLDKITVIYEYVTQNISYDWQLAETVQSGYVPDVDQVLASQKGICFDFASLMTAMLRSQGIPTRLAIGYAGTAYHAWIDVYTPETGWIEAVVYFDGVSWELMDPTFAAGMKNSDALAKYIGDGQNYQVKYYS